MYKWNKLGRVFNPCDFENRPTWMHEFAQAPCVLPFETYIRVYFNTRPAPDSKGQYISHCGYIDLSKDNLFEILRISKKPVLPLGNLGTFDEFGTYPISVIRHENKILAYYGGWTRCVSVPFNVSIGYGESIDDGQNFKKLGPGPVLSFSPDEPFILSGPKIRKFNNIFYLFYIAGRQWVNISGKPEPVYKIRMAHSDDGYTWEKINKNLIPDVLGINEAQASPDVIYANGTYHMFFCYRECSDFRRNRQRSYRIGYASSKDLLNWSRDDNNTELAISKKGFDDEMIAYPHVFQLNGETFMLYLGNEVGKYGFGLAKLHGEL